METPELKDTVIRMIASRSDEIVYEPTDGYYPFDVVVDAFLKGKEEGKADGKNELIVKLREKIIANADLAIDSVNKFINRLKQQGFSVNKIFLNHSITSTSIILAVPKEIFINDKFIDYAYEKVNEIKSESHAKNLNINISFLPEEEGGINLKALKGDGYFAMYDFNENKIISA